MKLTDREKTLLDFFAGNIGRHVTVEELAAQIYRNKSPSNWRTVVNSVMRSLCMKATYVSNLVILRTSSVGRGKRAIYLARLRIT